MGLLTGARPPSAICRERQITDKLLYRLPSVFERERGTGADSELQQRLTEMAASLTTVTPWQPPSDVQEALYQHLVERDNLLEIHQMLRNQLHALRQRPHVDTAVETHKQALIDELNRQISQIDRELEAWLSSSEWEAQATSLRSIKGIGLISAAWLLGITKAL